MNILFDIGHPAHVHLFRNFISFLKSKGENVTIASRDKEVTKVLLDYYGLEHIVISKPQSGYFFMLLELLRRGSKVFTLHRERHFDIAFGTSVSIGHLSLLSNVKSFNINEDDDDVVPLYVLLAYPFCTKIINPDCIRHRFFCEKRIKHNSYHELAYLHPNNFSPDRKVIEKYGLEEKKYVVARFSALKAHHDAKARGIDMESWNKIKTKLHGYKIITSNENKKEYQISPWDMHHVLFFAKLIICDSQTMTAEAAVLGTPSLRYNTFADKLSYLNELEHKYELTYAFHPDNGIEPLLKKLDELLSDNKLEEIFMKKRTRLLSEKCDLNQWMIDFFEKLKT